MAKSLVSISWAGRLRGAALVWAANVTASAARHEVARLCAEVERRGYRDGGEASVAVRVDDEHFAVTPVKRLESVIGASDVCVLRLADRSRVWGPDAPSLDCGLHAMILRAKTDAWCSVHTHHPAASACGLLGKALDVTKAAWKRSLGAVVPAVGYAPSGTLWQVGELGLALRADARAYLIRHHGALCCGSSGERMLQALSDLIALASSHLISSMQPIPGSDARRQSALAQLKRFLDGQALPAAT